MESAVSRISRVLMLCGILVVVSLVTTPAWADKIEADKGKVYKLDKQHGPWMVMVASLSEPPQRVRAGRRRLVHRAQRVFAGAAARERARERHS